MNLFEGVDAPDVFGALAEFHGKRGAALVAEPDRKRRHDLYHRQERWCVLDWDGGWERKQRREAQLFVSKRLNAVGLLVFAYDGDYWGYELFDNGEVLDRFVQRPDAASTWFADDPCLGSSSTLARVLGLPGSDLAPHLVRVPEEGDVLDFLRAIGLGLELRDGQVHLRSEVWRSFRAAFP
jgi:hypothetical protein